MARTHRRAVPRSLNDTGNHNGLVTHLEPDIMECEVKWALGSTAMNKVENPMDGGAWWATVHGVAKSRTRLSESLVLSSSIIPKNLACCCTHESYPRKYLKEIKSLRGGKKGRKSLNSYICTSSSPGSI